ncbi:MAG: acyltransferase [Lachnospiraceae bacterium]|nr:acyltransferase [Candidatus Minthocola equi]
MKKPVPTIKLSIGSFDFIKGLLMICIVFGHSSSMYLPDQADMNPALVYIIKFIASATNPLLFICSGMLYKDKDPKKLLKATFHDLIIPYLWVGLGVTICFPIVSYILFHSLENALSETFKYIVTFLLGYQASGETIFGISVYECAVVHFLLALFIANNLLNLILKIKNDIIAGAICLASAFASVFLYAAGLRVYCIPEGLMALMFVYAGYMIKKYDLINKVNSKPWLYLIIFAISCVAVRVGSFDMVHSEYNYPVLDSIGVLFPAFFLLAIGLIIGQSDNKFLDIFKTIGMYAYWILCLHSIELICIPWYKWMTKFENHKVLAYIGEMCINIAFIAIGCYIIKKYTSLKYRRKVKHV